MKDAKAYEPKEDNGKTIHHDYAIISPKNIFRLVRYLTPIAGAFILLGASIEHGRYYHEAWRNCT
jgi:hypothetical protein